MTDMETWAYREIIVPPKDIRKIIEQKERDLCILRDLLRTSEKVYGKYEPKG